MSTNMRKNRPTSWNTTALAGGGEERSRGQRMRELLMPSMRQLAALTLAGILAAGTLSGCSQASVTATGSELGSSQVVASTAESSVDEAVVESGAGQVDADTTIALAGDGATVEGDGVSVSAGEVTITEAGTYEVSGTLEEGRLVVDATGEVTICLNGAEIHNSEDDAIHVKSGSVTVVLVEGSVNRLSSADESYQAATDEEASGSALFSKEDLVITGEGELVIAGYINNGINGKAGVTIESGTISIVAANDGIKSSEGYVLIEGGSVDVTAGDEGVSAGTTLDVTGGDVVVDASGKGIKAAGDLTISGADTIVSVTSDDEGIESKAALTIDDGTVTVVAADDGINAGGSDAGDHVITINGGSVVVDARGDGLDSNGDIVVNGGTVVVFGPTSDGDSALDAAAENGGTCTVTGGTVLAIGSSGMAEGFGQASTQCSFMYGLDGYREAGSTIQVVDAAGNVLFECVAEKQFSNVVFSSPDLVSGETCSLVIDGDAAEVTLDGVSTVAGNAGMGMGGGMGAGMPDGQGGPGGMPDAGTDGMPEGGMGGPGAMGGPGGQMG